VSKYAMVLWHTHVTWYVNWVFPSCGTHMCKARGSLVAHTCDMSIGCFHQKEIWSEASWCQAKSTLGSTLTNISNATCQKLVVVGHCICMAGTSLNLVLVGLVFEGPVSKLKNSATGLDQDQKRLDILHAVMSSLIYQRLIFCGPRT